MRVTTSQNKKGAKITFAKCLQSIIYPPEKHSLEQAAFWHEVKVVCRLPGPLLFTLEKTGYWKQPLWLAGYVSL